MKGSATHERAEHEYGVCVKELLEAEVTEFLGRGKSQRQAQLAPVRLGYRNGYGKPRRVALTADTFTVRRPRMRDVYDGKRFKDGIAVRTMIEPTRKAA